MHLLLLAALVAPLQTEGAGKPAELFEVTRVVDGDTLWIDRDGQEEKLRLLSVDTEEKISGRPAPSATKPETVFGHETMLWTQDFFESLEPGRTPRVGLRFPGNEEERDIYGRLLCHVILPDGVDFNLLLVKLGKSPYFNKYGNSLIAHEAFVEAQKSARAKRLGVWNPRTNRPKAPNVPAALRPYDKLLPWWEARAQAIEFFRAAQAESGMLAADAPGQLASALERGQATGAVFGEAFGEIERFFDESDGSITVLFRSGDRRNALRVSLPAPQDPELMRLLRRSTEELRQNFVVVRAKMVRGPRGYRMVAGDAAAWRLAGPEPQLKRPAEARAQR